MKPTALQNLRAKLKANQPVYGLWVTLEAPAVSDIAAGLGLDWAVIDAGHAHLDWAEGLEHVRATVRSDTVALVHLAEPNAALVRRALDIGADGVVVPNVESTAQLRAIVVAARQPLGGIAPDEGAPNDADPLIVAMIQTTRAGWNIRELLGVEGVEMFFLKAAADTAAEQDRIVRQVRERGKYAGATATRDEDLPALHNRGFRMLGVGSDGGIIRGGIHAMMELIAKDARK